MSEPRCLADMPALIQVAHRTASARWQNPFITILREVRGSFELPVPRRALSPCCTSVPLEVRCMDRRHTHEEGFEPMHGWGRACNELGLFATSPIPAGTPVVLTPAPVRPASFRNGDVVKIHRQAVPRLREALKQFSQEVQIRFTNWAYGDPFDPEVLLLELGESRYMNGGIGDEVNLKNCGNEKQPAVVTRDIGTGEELLCDYSEILNGPDWWIELMEEMPYDDAVNGEGATRGEGRKKGRHARMRRRSDA